MVGSASTPGEAQKTLDYYSGFTAARTRQDQTRAGVVVYGALLRRIELHSAFRLCRHQHAVKTDRSDPSGVCCEIWENADIVRLVSVRELYGEFK